MLDLKLLEDKLDKALAAETTESLSVWLENKRIKNQFAYFGNGDFEDISVQTQPTNISFSSEKNSNFHIKPIQPTTDLNNTQLAMAA